MLVLIISSFPESIITFRGSLLNAILARGVVVHVAAPDLQGSHPVRKELEHRGIQVHAVPLRRTGMNPWADLVLLAELWRLMRQIDPSVVMGYTIKPVIYGMLAAWLAGVPRRCALITGLGYAFTGDLDEGGRRGFLRRLVRRLYGFALRRSHRVFFQNRDDEALFRELNLLPDTVSSTVVNGSGIDADEFVPASLPAEPRFLLIARLLGDKGVREYAEAAQRVRRRYPQAVFQLVGWIDDNPDAIEQRELDAWVAEGAVEYLGRLDDVRPAIADCRVYVLPSYREGTPRTVLEAMAMGRPIITTDAPGCRETVIEGDNGFLVPVQSVEALEQAMEAFIREPALAERMGRRSRQIAEEKYDVHRVNAVMIEHMLGQ